MRVAVVASAQIFGGFQNLPPPQSLDFPAFFGLSHLFPPRPSISVIFDTDLVTSQQTRDKSCGKTDRQPGAWISRLYLLLALVMLVLTLKTCVPAVDAALTRLSGAARQTKTVQAFAALTERLREGEPVREALSGSFEILTGAGN